MDAMTKGQRNLLLFLLGVVILFVPIRYVAMNNFEDRKSIISEKDKQQVYYNDLKSKDVNRDRISKIQRTIRKSIRRSLMNSHQSSIRRIQLCIYRVSRMNISLTSLL